MLRMSHITERKSRQRSTIKDVAAEAKVSISTVSLVMNEKDGVSPPTRERVLSAAERLGYVPTHAARRLVMQRTGNIGFVVREDHFTRSEPFYTRVFLGSEFEARRTNVYVLLTTIPGEYVPGEHTPRFLRERNVDGLLVAGKVDSDFLTEVRRLGVPTVLIDYQAPGFSSVMIDNQNGARSAVEHLIERGHRSIAFLGADLSHPSIQARQEGYRLALAAAGMEVDRGLVITADDAEPNLRTGSELGPKLFEHASAPTAVFCVNDALALGVLEAARQHDVSIPDDLAVVGFDDVPGAATSMPALTTVRVFKEHLGELSLRALDDLIESQDSEDPSYDRGAQALQVATELVVRSSS